MFVRSSAGMPKIEYYHQGKKLLEFRSWMKPSKHDDAVIIEGEEYYIKEIKIEYKIEHQVLYTTVKIELGY